MAALRKIYTDLPCVEKGSNSTIVFCSAVVGNWPIAEMTLGGTRRQLTEVLRTNYDFELRLRCYQPKCLDSIVKPLLHKAFLHVAKNLNCAKQESLTKS